MGTSGGYARPSADILERHTHGHSQDRRRRRLRSRSSTDVRAARICGHPITSTLDTEISSENSLFDVRGVARRCNPPTSSEATTPGSFDTIPRRTSRRTHRRPRPSSTLDYELYGVDPIAAGSLALAADSGARSTSSTAQRASSTTPTTSCCMRWRTRMRLIPTRLTCSDQPHHRSRAGPPTAASAFESFYNFGIGDLSWLLQGRSHPRHHASIALIVHLSVRLHNEPPEDPPGVSLWPARCSLVMSNAPQRTPGGNSRRGFVLGQARLHAQDVSSSARKA